MTYFNKIAYTASFLNSYTPIFPNSLFPSLIPHLFSLTTLSLNSLTLFLPSFISRSLPLVLFSTSTFSLPFTPSLFISLIIFSFSPSLLLSFNSFLKVPFVPFINLTLSLFTLTSFLLFTLPFFFQSFPCCLVIKYKFIVYTLDKCTIYGFHLSFFFVYCCLHHRIVVAIASILIVIKAIHYTAMSWKPGQCPYVNMDAAEQIVQNLECRAEANSFPISQSSNCSKLYVTHQIRHFYSVMFFLYENF